MWAKMRRKNAYVIKSDFVTTHKLVTAIVDESLRLGMRRELDNTCASKLKIKISREGD